MLVVSVCFGVSLAQCSAQRTSWQENQGCHSSLWHEPRGPWHASLITNKPRNMKRILSSVWLCQSAVKWSLNAWCLLAFCPGSFASEATQPPQPTSPRILVLSSYHVGYDWADDVMRGVRSTLRKSAIVSHPYFEYMDTRRHAKPEDLLQLYSYYTLPLNNDKCVRP